MELTAEELQKKIDDAVGPIKAKNTELLGKMAKYKNYDDLNIDDLKAAADKLAGMEAEKLEAEGKWQEAYETLKKEHQGVVDELKISNKRLKDDFDSSRLTNEITIGLMGHDIIGDLSEVAVTTLLSQAEIDSEGQVVFGDKPAGEFIAEWADGPVGKYFIKSGNSGGGSPGSGGESGENVSKFFNPDSPDFNQTEQLAVKRSDPALHETLTKQYAKNKPLPMQAPRIA